MNYSKLIMVLVAFFCSTIIIAQEQKEIKTDSFDQVKFEGSANWVLIPSDNEKVIIESSNADVFNYIQVENNGKTLIISTTDKSRNITKLFKSVTINVYFKSIEEVSLGGVGSVKMTEKYSTSDLIVTLRGTGSIDLSIDCSDFIGNMYGTGSLSVSGKATSSTIRVEGVGSFEGYDFVTHNTNVTVSGVGGAKVNATNTLTATINGVGSIRYKGDPKNKNFNSNGIGSIKESK